MSLWVYMSISYIHIQWRCDSRILFDHIRLLLIAYYRVEEQYDICEEKKTIHLPSMETKENMF